LRTEFLTASVTSVLVGGAVAWYESGSIDWGLFLLTLAGAACLHLGTNVANDYFDHRSGNDALNIRYVRPFTGGSRLIQEGLITPKTVLVTSISLCAVGLVIGIILAVARGPFVILLGLIGFVSGFFYAAPPFQFAHRGVGELLVGINFGLLIVIGTYYVQTGGISTAAVIAALPVSLLIAAVIIINEFQDSNADARVGKRTIIVRLGTGRGVVLYAAVTLCAYVPLIAGVASKLLPVETLLALLSLPLVLKAIVTARRHHSATKELAPANALTIMIHLATGLLLCAGYLIAG
jgi:1,4-dihydroxy-2-naphthoate octaprenyltransferase